MTHTKIIMDSMKKIALVAHDNMKQDLLDWVQFNRDLLSRHRLFATGSAEIRL